MPEPIDPLLEISASLADLDAAGLRRRRRVVTTPCAPVAGLADRPDPVIAFCANDYLGLAAEPSLADAAGAAAQAWGVGSGASAKAAAGEVFIPVLAGTMTIIAPFFPLLFWKGIIGKFMIYLPVMLIFTLFASLIVPFIINPIFAVSFMKPEGREYEEPKSKIWTKWWLWVSVAAGILMHLAKHPAIGNFLFVMSVLAGVNTYLVREIIHFFQEKVLPFFMNTYEMLLRWILVGNRPVYAYLFSFVLFFISLFALIARKPDFPFFPSGQPNIIYVYPRIRRKPSAECGLNLVDCGLPT